MIFLSEICPLIYNAIDAYVYILHGQHQQILILASLGNSAIFSNRTNQGKCIAIYQDIRETEILQQCRYQSRSTLTSPTLADLLEDSHPTLHSIIRIWTRI